MKKPYNNKPTTVYYKFSYKICSKKVRNNLTVMYTLPTSLIRPIHLKVIIQLLVHLHYTRQVITPVAVVRSRPYCHQVLLLKPYRIPLLRQLMRPRYQTQSIVIVKLIHNLTPEQPSRASTTACPCINLLGIGPHQVSEWTFSGYLNFPIQLSNLIESMNIR